MFRTKNELQQLTIKKGTPIKEAIKAIDSAHFGIGVVVDENNRILGILTDPDIRRLILNAVNFSDTVDSVMNTSPTLVVETEISMDSLKKIFIDRGFSQIPVINAQNELVDLVFKSDLVKKEEGSIFRPDRLLDNLVVIMAGGRGTRMEPFTTILPKPLIPINGKSMIEIIMGEYERYGMKDFCISVNYKANLIKAYLTDENLEYNISYINEDQPLGTAGSLHLLGDNLPQKAFFVSNCDIIIKDDYSRILDFHIEGGYSITLVASLQHHRLPYGICEIEQGGDLIAIREKPEFDYLVNTGMYIINPDVLEYIPKDEFFHITHLMEKIKKKGMKVGVYPVSEKAWIDVGQWSEYKDAVKQMGAY